MFDLVFLQKDVDLSKDDLLGDLLQDLHSEVSPPWRTQVDYLPTSWTFTTTSLI